MRWTEIPFGLKLLAAFVVGWYAIDIFGAGLLFLAILTMIGD
jgi:hypothetical protein